MKAHLTLACHGRMKCGLVLCSGTANRIADLRRIPSDKDHIIDYLDKHAKLFSSRVIELNRINNIVNYLAQEDIIIKQVENTIYDIFALHKQCGLYLYVDPIEVEYE